MGHASSGHHSGTARTRPGEKARQQQTRTEDSGTPASGPHDKEELTNPDATPGAGALPPAGADDGMDSTSG